MPNKGIGFNIPFNGNIGLNSTITTKDAIRSNLLNFLLTNTRERIMNPNFGSKIKNQLFEQISQKNFNNIKTIINNYIKDNFPQIIINTLDINEINNLIDITFNYSIKNTNINDSMQLTFNNDK